jgi:beta-lactamase regulating signal transducer with metallopeptidase domain
MTPAFHLDAIAQMSAARIVDCLVEGALVAGFVALVLRVAPRQNSGARFAVWFSALMAMVALPLFGGAGWADGAGASVSSLARRPEITLPGSWALWLFWAWAVSAGVGLVRVGVGLWLLGSLRRSCVEIDTELLDPELRETLTRSFATQVLTRRKTRSAALCVSDRVGVPTAIGFVNPVVVIPRWLLQELSPSELKQVVLHELAHLRRWDDWTNLAQKIVKALLFFHPAVWWIEKQVSLEREMACDDAVLAETANPHAYAACLTHLAEKSFVRRSLALAQAALGRIRQTSLRVAQILDADRPRSTKHAWQPAVALVAGFAVVCAVCVSRAPRLVAFEDSHPTATQIARASSGPDIPASTSRQQAAAAESGTTLRPMKATFRSRQPRVITAKSKQQNFDSPEGEHANATMINANVGAVTTAPTWPSMAEDLFYLADFSTNPALVTETVFVVVEGSNPGSTGVAAYRISVWRIVIQQPAGNPNPNTIPHKET